MKRLVSALVAAGVIVGLGCVRIPKKFEAHITVDIRHHVDEQADSVLDFVEGKSDTLAISPAVTEISQRLRERHAQFEALKKKGCAGEDNRGYVELREAERIEDPEERNQAQRIIAAENKDRKKLYKEIAQINKEDRVSVSMVERVFAQKRLERAKPGELFQLPKPGKDFDAFRASEAGQRLGAGCVAESWVRIK